MKRIAPVVTVLVVAVLGAALFVANALGNPANAPVPTAAREAAAPPTPPPPAVAEKAYAGRSSGNEVTVAVAVKAGKAVAYICDGKKVEYWLDGTVTGKDVTLKSADGKATIAGTVDDKASFGTVTAAGKSWPYSAAGVVAPAGLYQGRADVRGVAIKVGWIVQGDGSQTGVLDAAGALRPAPVLDPADLGGVRVDGAPVTVVAVDGATAVQP